ncbi:ENO [Mytilus coruscus]|uniref:ENO n=1 Tax=Mytilus coruscus TaxID=42192 RepID=A0A6J8BE03_MYTCO|nr:ENO [Mytilus coruscus]
MIHQLVCEGSIKQELQSCKQTGHRSIKQELQSCWQQTGHAGIHDSTNWYVWHRSIKQGLSHAGNNWPCRNSMILPTGMYRYIKQEPVMLNKLGNKLAHAGIHDSTNWSIKQELSHAGNKLAMQEFMILPTGMYRSINKNFSHAGKQTGHAGIHDSTNWSINKNFSHAGNKTGHAGIHDSTNWPCRNRSIKQELQSCWQQTGHAGIHDSTNWSIKQELSHAGNKLAMQEFMILPTGMYRSIKQELSHAINKLAMQEFMILPTGLKNKNFSHAGNKLAMQEFMILPTGTYRSIKQELSHAGNKLAMQEFMILPTGTYRSIKQELSHATTNWPCRNS